MSFIIYTGDNRLPKTAKMGSGFRVPYYLLLATATLPVTVLFTWIFLLSKPCLPINIIYYSFGKCSEQNTGFAENINFDMLVYLFSATFMSFVVLFTFASCVLEYVPFMPLVCHCFINYIMLVEHRVNTSKSNNYTDFLFIWRELQLLVTSYNKIHQGVLSSCCTALCSFVAVISIYCTVVMSSSITPMLGLFLLLVVETTLITIEADGHFKGQVYARSTFLVGKIKKICSTGKLRIRYVKSLQSLKISIGFSNYYDKLFALNLLNFNISQTVTLLLL